MALPLKTMNGNDGRLFLHFMGELLRTASSIKEKEKVNYDWFADSLMHFDDFLANVDRKKDTLQYEIKKPLQLRLLEGDSQENSGYL